jgi:hypothetical protein
MYIHIGEEYSLRAKDIIAILDKDSASSCFVEEFLKQREKELINLSKNPYKSIVITEGKVFLSPFASGTLKKRSTQMSEF